MVKYPVDSVTIPEDYCSVKLSEKDALFSIAKILNLPILVRKSQFTTIYYVIDGNNKTVYTFHESNSNRINTEVNKIVNEEIFGGR